MFFVQASDPDEDELTYLWTLNGAAVSTSDTWEYVPDYTESGEKEVDLTVSDGEANISYQWIVWVENVNRPPTIDSYDPWERTPMMKEMESLTFFVQASDPDEDILTYLWTLNAIPVSPFDNWQYTPCPNESGVKNVEVTVSDGKKEVSLKWIVTVDDVNQPPEIVSYDPDTETPVVEEGDNLTFSVNVYDPDRDSLTYYWALNGTRVRGPVPDSWTYSPNYNESGVKIVNSTISDGDLIVSVEWIVTVDDVNQPPNITYSPTKKNITIKRDGGISFSANASDPDTDRDPPSYIWKVDGEEKSTSENWKYSPDRPLLSKTEVIVNLTVSDGDITVTEEWNVVLKPSVDPMMGLLMLVLLFLVITFFFGIPSKLIGNIP